MILDDILDEDLTELLRPFISLEIQAAGVAVKRRRGRGEAETPSPPPKKHARSGWTTDEDEYLTRLWQDNVPVKDIARRLPGRSEAAVQSRAHRLDLPSHRALQNVTTSRRRYDLEHE
jgi:hypothetical protein